MFSSLYLVDEAFAQWQAASSLPDVQASAASDQLLSSVSALVALASPGTACHHLALSAAAFQSLASPEVADPNLAVGAVVAECLAPAEGCCSSVLRGLPELESAAAADLVKGHEAACRLA